LRRNRTDQKTVDEKTMQTPKSNRELWFAIIAIALFAYLIFRLSSSLAELEQQHDAATFELLMRIETLEQEVARISADLYAEDVSGEEIDFLTLARPEEITRGLYVLEREVSLRDSSGEVWAQSYTIYHIKSGVSRGDKSWNLNLGLAVSGMTSAPIFYMDYTDDNAVNMDIMKDFARLLPFGNLLAQRIDQQRSQQMYNAFLTSYRDASYTGLDDVQATGGRISRALVQFLEEQSGAIAEWISRSDHSD